MDRSGRTYEEYRQLYWDERDRRKEAEAQLDAIAKWKREFRSLKGIRVAGAKADKAVDEVIVTVCDELQAILEKE